MRWAVLVARVRLNRNTSTRFATRSLKERDNLQVDILNEFFYKCRGIT